MHLQEWLSPFTLAPTSTALRLVLDALLRDLRPLPHETWADKRRRMSRAVVHPLAPKSGYERKFGSRRARGEAAVAARGPGPTGE
jgi:hypothetical protein